MQQKSWPIIAPALAAAAWKAEMPGMTLTAMRAGLEVDHLIDQRRHGIDAGIAGADERDLLAFLRQRDGVAHAVFLAAQREAVFLLAGLHIRRRDRDRGRSPPSRWRLRGPRVRRARASPACRGRCPRHARCRARGRAVSRIGCGALAMAQVPRAERVFSTMSSDVGPAPARAAASATPGTPTSFATISDGFLRRGVSRLQFLRREEARGHAEMRGDGMDGRLIRLEVDRGDGRRGTLARGRCSASTCSASAMSFGRRRHGARSRGP